MKRSSNTAASGRANTRPNVSCEATPFSNGRNRLSQSSLARPHRATAAQVSAPLKTAQMAVSNSSSRS